MGRSKHDRISDDYLRMNEVESQLRKALKEANKYIYELEKKLEELQKTNTDNIDDAN
jgi:predicted RNase H-like nuclease (RuvC/YqgF family)